MIFKDTKHGGVGYGGGVCYGGGVGYSGGVGGGVDSRRGRGLLTEQSNSMK